MTLCTAWIRQANDTEELIFATDSCLTGGEKWKHGIKLFELPRKDCLLSFAGSTMRAYPLVLNLVSAIHFDDYLQSPFAKLNEVLVYISDLFTELVKKIISEIPNEDINDLRGGAKFLFGGWDWEKGSFRVWKLHYSSEVEGFIFDELNGNLSKKRFYTFLGDPSPEIGEEAFKAYKKMVYDEDKQDDPIDMEPLKILRDFSLNKDIREVDGSLQIAKIYKSNRTEFFGVYWASSKGKPCFQGREYNEVNKPLVRYFNPDTFEIIESDLPARLANITEEIYQDNCEFIQECFDESGFLKDSLSEKAKHELRLIFKDVAYRQFLCRLEAEQRLLDEGEEA
ncbi:hypothetical protein Sgly_0847 [Syntrophobotulus glycolicus DSM 8271]|uniref:Uncharacterized protein n=1 Tax=Syntrophobotulus glycolicus (strain DSM 8271 / FlGlyR) TaxID=645991 RepID=F0T1T2_SYNGF|nr:hypothetical protein [Syntrophobotulus glycolicus]ADY55196.1 hypothetical protein Sgly_0847 [Syntrophobotulus glycolicus DSM 8271]